MLEAPGPINFTVFLSMFGEKLKGEEEALCGIIIIIIMQIIILKKL